MGDEDKEGARLADELAAQCIKDNQAVPPQGGSQAARKTSRVPWIVALVSAAVVIFQVPSLRASLAGKPSLHAGVQDADANTEACIDTLWAISALVQEGEPADVLARLPFAEPITRAAYAISIVDDEIVVACPNPAAHRLKQLQITESDPMPEAR